MQCSRICFKAVYNIHRKSLAQSLSSQGLPLPSDCGPAIFSRRAPGEKKRALWRRSRPAPPRPWRGGVRGGVECAPGGEVFCASARFWLFDALSSIGLRRGDSFLRSSVCSVFSLIAAIFVEHITVLKKLDAAIGRADPPCVLTQLTNVMHMRRSFAREPCGHVFPAGPYPHKTG